MKLFFKATLAFILCLIIGAVFGFISNFFEVFPLFALICAGLTYGTATIISKKETKLMAGVAMLLGLVTFYAFISTGFFMLRLEIEEDIQAYTQEYDIHLTEKEFEAAVDYYINEYLTDTTGYTGKIGFMALEARRGFFSSSRLKYYDDEGTYFIGAIMFICKSLIMIFGPAMAVIHKDETEPESSNPTVTPEEVSI